MFATNTIPNWLDKSTAMALLTILLWSTLATLTSRVHSVSPLVLVGLVAVLPLFATDYYTGLAVKIMIYALFALSLQLLVGGVGLVSLGHAFADEQHDTVVDQIEQRLEAMTCGNFTLGADISIDYQGPSIGLIRVDGSLNATEVLSLADDAMYQRKQLRHAQRAG